MMIGSSNNNRENYLTKCFRTQEKENQVKSNSRLTANRPSNNWALVCRRPVQFYDLELPPFQNNVGVLPGVVKSWSSQ